MIQIIPVLGLHTAFHGKPADVPPEWRFSNQIMNHLLDTAEQRRQISHLAGLIVAPENHKAKRFYEKFGFQKYADAVEDAYERMIVQV
jgi:ribosomal protein S18 acetylase RimI-like enzyme